VVGVVEDVKNQFLTETDEPFVYLPLRQAYDPATKVVVRAAGGTGSVAPTLRRTILEVDPSLSLEPVVRLERYTSLGILPQRVAAGLSSILGGLALLLSGLGIYGVVAFAVSRRTREMGIRMALGARQRSLLLMVVRGGLALALPGLILGIMAAVGVGYALRALLLGVSPTDPVALGAVIALLVAVVAVASLVPGRKAARVDPMTALRSE
jgi:ABC-type antimicrobial peptide transport system permease subunit